MSDCKNCEAEDVPLNTEGLCPSCATNVVKLNSKEFANSKIAQENLKSWDNLPNHNVEEEQEPERWDGLS